MTLSFKYDKFLSMYKEGGISVYEPGEEIPSIGNLHILGPVTRRIEYWGANIADTTSWLKIDRKSLREGLVEETVKMGGDTLQISVISEKVGIVTYVFEGMGWALRPY